MTDRYWMTCCSECGGKGQVVYKSPMFKVFTRMQDEGWELAKTYDSVVDATKYVEERKKHPFGSCRMYAIVSPDGKIVGEWCGRSR